MSSNQGAVSGVAVAVATVGGILVYAGFRGVSPLQALRDVSSGKPPGVESRSVEITTGLDSNPGAAADQAAARSAGTLRSQVVAAASTFRGDKYSQARRRQSGYSDCSSFVDKALVAAGAKPPVAWANTAAFRLSSTWQPIAQRFAQAGDVAVSSSHMVLVTGAAGASAIGQQNPKTNVNNGSVSQLMIGSSSYKYYTWTGYPDGKEIIAQSRAASAQGNHGKV